MLIVAIVVAIFLLTRGGGAPTVTEGQTSQLDTGDSREDVEAALGGAGEEVEYTDSAAGETYEDCWSYSVEDGDDADFAGGTISEVKYCFDATDTVILIGEEFEVGE